MVDHLVFPGLPANVDEARASAEVIFSKLGAYALAIQRLEEGRGAPGITDAEIEASMKVSLSELHLAGGARSRSRSCFSLRLMEATYAKQIAICSFLHSSSWHISSGQEG